MRKQVRIFGTHLYAMSKEKHSDLTETTSTIRIIIMLTLKMVINVHKI